MANISKLISGFRVFKSTTFERQKDIIRHLIEQGHKPTTMVISCAEIRMAPAEIFATNPGELYVINNIGGLVPKYDKHGTHGILSAIEYAVTILEVENIIILGHAKCEGIKMMMSDKFSSGKNLSESMKTWLSVAQDAKEAVKSQLGDKSEEEQLKACEHESIVISLRNLIEYPYVAKRIQENKLNIFGWHFNAERGALLGFNVDNGFFEPIS
ncbi:MAG: hypothetical protein FJ368_01840 [Pelagibacterales bacterium]|nr:hypothetical protein [Pelagibacterales bacterium]